MDPLQFAENQGIERENVPDFLSALATDTYQKYLSSGSENDIYAAVEYSRSAVHMTPDGHQSLVGRLNYLVCMLESRYECTGDAADLEEAIRVGQQAVDLTPEDHPDRSTYLNNLANGFQLRYERTEETADIETAIRVAQQAVDSTPEDQPDRAASLSNLGNMLQSWYRRTGNITDLEKSIRVAQEAVDSMPEHHSDWAACLNNLGDKLEGWYERTGEMADLEKAIRMVQKAVDSTPKVHPDRASSLNNLGNMLGSRYKRTGEMVNLEDAIGLAQQAVDLTTHGHPDLACWLNGLGDKFCSRYERTGEMVDLDKAIEMAKLAVDSTPDGHPDSATYLNNLGTILQRRYERTGEMADLAEALRVTRQAIDLTPECHPERAGWLSNWGVMLQSRYERMGEMSDLEEAIRAAQQAVASTPKGHLDRAGRLNNLGNRLNCRYKWTHQMADLEEAIQVAQQAVVSTPEDHPDRVARLINLGNRLKIRHEQTRAMDDLKEALDCFLSSSQTFQAPPVLRVQASRAAIEILRSQGDWRQAIALAKEALQLLPLVCDRYYSRDDQQHAIIQTSGLAADTCSLTLRTGDVDKALQQLEFGRGLILGYIIDSRSDLSALKSDCPTLGERYETLRFKASRQIDDQAPAIRDQLYKERREATREIEDCLRQIRQVPAHERFLLEPTIDELKSLAIEGPIVVVNVTDISADAIILLHDRGRALSLPGLSSETAPKPLRQEFERYASSRRGDYERDIASETEARVEPDKLSWLWSNCVKLVLGELETMGFLRSPEVPRIWWVGSGIASSFPFHAAGAYSEGPTENTLSRVVSSYTPTIKALAYSRLQASRWARSDDKNASILIVTMPTTPGQKPLSGVDRERRAIEKACRGVCSCAELRLPTADEVLEKIPTSDITHFACHGSSDRANPSGSHLVLQRSGQAGPVVDRLTVSRISTVATQGRAWIAFLSACSTAEVKAGKLADEGLHIAGAFQVVGFAHVIGSLWSADDDVCVRVAEIFYGHLSRSGRAEFSNRLVASALRNAVLQVRLEYPCNPYLWAPFVHFGA